MRAKIQRNNRRRDLKYIGIILTLLHVFYIVTIL
jgi:hypothetical protein